MAGFSQLAPGTGMCLVSSCMTFSKSWPVFAAAAVSCASDTLCGDAGCKAFVEGAAQTAVRSGHSRVRAFRGTQCSVIGTGARTVCDKHRSPKSP